MCVCSSDVEVEGTCSGDMVVCGGDTGSKLPSYHNF